MSDTFLSPEEQLAKAVQELADIKELLRQVSRKMVLIERRVQSALPRKSDTRLPQDLSRPKLVSDAQALEAYNEMVAIAKDKGLRAASQRLAGYSRNDLQMIARELGVGTGKGKTSKRLLVEGITGRMNESLQLGKHVLRVSEDTHTYSK